MSPRKKRRAARLAMRETQKMIRNTILILTFAAFTATAEADESAFSTGPIFKDYGPVSFG